MSVITLKIKLIICYSKLKYVNINLYYVLIIIIVYNLKFYNTNDNYKTEFLYKIHVYLINAALCIRRLKIPDLY